MKKDRKYVNLLFTYERIGDVSYFKIVGFPIYQRVGNVRKILFWVLKDNND